MTTLLVLLGPTAAGKTRMSIEVAQELDSHIEIVSCDSMAVYRELDVVADKPSHQHRSLVPHHLIDVVDPDVEFTVAEYRDLARQAIDDIVARGAVPVLVGGSGLYFRAVVDELSFAPTSIEVRERLEAMDPGALYERLLRADPQRAGELDPRNVRRVVRAVEVLELTGRRPSELRDAWQREGDRYALTALGLIWDRDELIRRAEARLHERIADMVEEVRRVRASGLSKTAGQALGVKELVPYLDGEATFDEAVDTLVRHTKAFVRRQLSWFRAESRIEWVDASELGWDGARERIAQRFRSALT